MELDYLWNLLQNEHFVFARPITYIPISVSSQVAFKFQSIASRSGDGKMLKIEFATGADTNIMRLQSRLSINSSAPTIIYVAVQWACIQNDINLGINRHSIRHTPNLSLFLSLSAARTPFSSNDKSQPMYGFHGVSLSPLYVSLLENALEYENRIKCHLFCLNVIHRYRVQRCSLFCLT